MSHELEDVLLRARQLSTEEQQQLVQALSRSTIQSPDSKRPKTLFDALSESGLIGCIKDGPADLATNPKYMEGFGEDVY